MTDALVRWWQELRSVLLALRVIAFEKIDTAVLVVWGCLTLPVLLIALPYGYRSAVVILAVAGVLFFLLRRWARENRFRLIRPSDRVEFADVNGSEEETPLQAFEKGVVLRRMPRETIEQTAAYDPQLMERSRWFYAVATPSGMRIVAYEWIVGIEIESGE